MLAIFAALLLVVLGSRVLTVAETELAVCSGNGSPTNYGPGLHWCWPPEHIVRVDGRVISQRLPGEAFLSSEQQSLSIDLVINWRVANAATFLAASGADRNQATARTLLGQHLGQRGHKAATGCCSESLRIQANAAPKMPTTTASATCPAGVL